MRVSELYGATGPCRGREVYIVGTGPSMRLFPIDYLENKTCIMLNDSARAFGLGPIVFTNNLRWIKELDNPNIRYRIVKARLKTDPEPQRTDNHVAWTDGEHYCFSYREKPWDDVSHCDRQVLWCEPDFYWNIARGSVAVFACQFAALAGASAIVLVGCDCCDLGQDAYATPAIARLRPAYHDYDAYRAGLRVIQDEAWLKFHVPIMTLSPFCGLKNVPEQYVERLG